jgi:hypothetical protein
MVRNSVMGLLLGSSGLSCRGSLVGAHAPSTGWPENPGSDGASPYHLERRFMLRTILLVVVLVLVLDLLWGRSHGVTRAARFGVESRSGAVEVG